MDNENLLKMAHLISRIRKENNLTQKDLAEKMGVTDKAVSKWERGLSCPDISLLSRLSLILGVTTSELLSGEREHPSTPDAEAKIETIAQVIDNSTINRTLRKARWILLAKASATALLVILFVICCNLAIGSGLGWAIIPLKITFFIWLALILGTFIMRKNRISSTLLCSSLIYFSTYYYSALNETQSGVVSHYNGFPKAYLPHYTIILIMFIVSLVLIVISLLKKNKSADATFLLATVSITNIILSLLTVPSIMDYVDINALGVDGRFTFLLMLNVVINSVLLALFARRYIGKIFKPQ